jgi:hypothetical protein
MEKEILKKIFDFIKKNDNRNVPFIWKLLNNEPFTEKELDFKGDLELNNSEITHLPQGLVVDGNLNLSKSEIQSLPEGLKVGGSLSLFDCAIITSLPEGLKVGVNLYLKGCKNITSLPKGLKVGYHLDISDSGLKDYSNKQIRKMIEPNGHIKGNIFR